MKKYWTLLLILFMMGSCEKNKTSKEVELELPKLCNLSLLGSIISSSWDDSGASFFKIQLIKGDVDLSSFNENYTHPNAQIFVTTKNNDNFEFNGLQEGKYTLIATKRGYVTFSKSINLKKDGSNLTSIKMETAKLGFTGKLQILSEDGKDLSEIKLQHSTTTSVFFYLYNGTGSSKSWGSSFQHYEGHLSKSFIINGEIERLNSNWIKEIKPSGGILKPNEIQLIEVVIDPILYLLIEHSKCDVRINGLKIVLKF